MPFKRVIMDPTRSVPPQTARDGCRSCTRKLLPKSRDRSSTEPYRDLRRLDSLNQATLACL